MSLNIPLFNSHLPLATYQIEGRSIEVVRQPDGQVSAKSGDGRNYTLKGLPSSHLSPEHIEAARDYFAHAKPISDPFTDSLSFAGSLKGGGAGASSLFGPRRSEEVQQQTALIKAAAKNNDSAKFNQLIEEFSKIFSKLPTQPFSVVRDLIETLNAMQEFPLKSKVSSSPLPPPFSRLRYCFWSADHLRGCPQLEARCGGGHADFNRPDFIGE